MLLSFRRCSRSASSFRAIAGPSTRAPLSGRLLISDPVRGGRGRPASGSRCARAGARERRGRLPRRRGRRACRSQRRGRAHRPRAAHGRARRPLAHDRETQHRLADPLHDRLLLARERDLLLARRDRRPCARADPARVPDRRRDVRGHGDDLVEGASLHQDRGSSTVFARYAFDELVSFIAGWAILLDYVILIADHGVLRDPVPAGLLGSSSETRARRSATGTDLHRCGRAQQHPRLRHAAARDRSGSCSRANIALQAVHRRARPDPVLRSEGVAGPDPPRQRPDVVEP